MEINGTHIFQAPRTMVWEALMDPTVLARALPGGDRLEKVGENDYTAAMNVRVGPVQGKFEGKVELNDIRPLEGYHLKVNGQGAPGFVSGVGTLHLTDDGEGTLLTYAGDVQVGGRIASVGQRLLDSTARSLVRQGLKALDEQLQLRMDPPAPEAIPAPEMPALQAALPSSPSTPSPAVAPVSPSPAKAARMTAAVVRDVAQDIASDYIAVERQEKVFYALLGALAMLAFVVLVRLVQKR